MELLIVIHWGVCVASCAALVAICLKSSCNSGFAACCWQHAETGLLQHYACLESLILPWAQQTTVKAMGLLVVIVCHGPSLVCRYRALEPGSGWIVRPHIEPHGKTQGSSSTLQQHRHEPCMLQEHRYGKPGDRCSLANRAPAVQYCNASRIRAECTGVLHCWL